MSDSSKIKLISFDIWMTLLKSNPQFKTDRSVIMGNALGYGDRMDEIIAASKIVDDEVDLITEETGKDFDFKARFARIAEKIGVTFSFTEEELENLEEKIGESFIELMPSIIESDLLDTLARLKDKGMKIALLSNTGFVRGSTMRKALDALGILELADYTLFSNELGVAKPDPRIYQELLTLCGANPEEIIHVGDNMENDYRGALRAGIYAVYFNIKGTKEENVEMVHKLSELPEFIERERIVEKEKTFKDLIR